MTAKEAADRLCAALETHHMSIEGDIYYYLAWMGEIIDLFDDDDTSEAREELSTFTDSLKVWLEDLG